MAWSVSVESKQLSGETFMVVLVATDAARSVRKTYSTQAADPEWVKTQARKLLRNLEAQDALHAGTEIGAVDTAVASPTQAEIDAAEFARRWRQYKGMRAAIGAGLMTEADTSYVNLVGWLKTNFKVAYVNGME